MKWLHTTCSFGAGDASLFSYCVCRQWNHNRSPKLWWVYQLLHHHLGFLPQFHLLAFFLLFLLHSLIISICNGRIICCFYELLLLLDIIVIICSILQHHFSKLYSHTLFCLGPHSHSRVTGGKPAHNCLFHCPSGSCQTSPQSTPILPNYFQIFHQQITRILNFPTIYSGPINCRGTWPCGSFSTSQCNFQPP